MIPHDDVFDVVNCVEESYCDHLGIFSEMCVDGVLTSLSGVDVDKERTKGDAQEADTKETGTDVNACETGDFFNSLFLSYTPLAAPPDA